RTAQQMSVTVDGSGLKLSGDATTPGNSKYYGTDGTGTKGYFALPAASSPPTRQYLTSGTGATYTTPANCTKLIIKMIGGGGGGGAVNTNNGSSGGRPTFYFINATGCSGGENGSGAGLRDAGGREWSESAHIR